jgi:hypothetical protein
MSWTKEQKEAMSQKAKDRWAAKRGKDTSNLVSIVPTVQEATEIVDEVNKELGGEAMTVEEITLAVEAPVATAPVPPLPKDEVPIHVTYIHLKSRNFKLTLADPRRGKKLIDDTRVADYTIKFRERRYETKSMEERVGIELSPSFLCGDIDIFTGKVARLYPDMPRQERKKGPTVNRMVEVLGLTQTDDVKPNPDLVETWS